MRIDGAEVIARDQAGRRGRLYRLSGPVRNAVSASPGMENRARGLVISTSEGCATRLRFPNGNEMLGWGVDEGGARDKFEALGLGVPPLPLWAHGEPAAMPALLFFALGAARPRVHLSPPVALAVRLSPLHRA
jgi:hypothetical protein